MADYLVKDTDMIAVAEAIRTKGGTSAALTFPEGFVDAVGAIQAGGEEDLFLAFLNKKMTDFVMPESLSEIRGYLFYGDNTLVSADLRKLSGTTSNSTTYIGQCAFRNCTSLTTVLFPADKTVCLRNQAFYGCSKLQSIEWPETITVITSTTQAFYGCTSLTAFTVPISLNTQSTGMFQNCSKLAFVDMKTSYIPANTFNACSVLKTIVNRSSSMATLSNSNAFTGTPFATNGTGGKMYVLEALVESYKVSTNWVTLYKAGTLTILPIEGSEYE